MDYKHRFIEDHKRIDPYIHCTPVMTSGLIDEKGGCSIFFKCENFQKMGAFKMRGATNAILQLSKEKLARGVVTHSSGNMAQAVSLAAKSIGVPAYIVMPENAPSVKKQAVEAYNGNISISGNNISDRQQAANKIIAEKGCAFIHPSNDIDVIIGQGTAAKELLEEIPDLDAIITPVGGGGLLAGTALAAEYFGKNCKVYAGEPLNADDAYRSMQSGRIEYNDHPDTIADGLRTNLGDINFPIILKYVEEIIRVEEEEIVAAMRLIWERMKIIIEPSCAVPYAALLKQKEKFAGKKVGIILSGGNVDLTNLPF